MPPINDTNKPNETFQISKAQIRLRMAYRQSIDSIPRGRSGHPTNNSISMQMAYHVHAPLGSCNDLKTTLHCQAKSR